MFIQNKINFKDVYMLKDNMVMAVSLPSDACIEQMDEELNALNQLKEPPIEISTVHATGGFEYEGRPAMVMERMEGSDRDLLAENLDGIRMLPMPESERLTAIVRNNKGRAIDSLCEIKKRVEINKIEIMDIHFLIAADGEFVVSNPYEVVCEVGRLDGIKYAEEVNENYTISKIDNLMEYIKGL